MLVKVGSFAGRRRAIAQALRARWGGTLVFATVATVTSTDVGLVDFRIFAPFY